MITATAKVSLSTPVRSFSAGCGSLTIWPTPTVSLASATPAAPRRRRCTATLSARGSISGACFRARAPPTWCFCGTPPTMTRMAMRTIRTAFTRATNVDWIGIDTYQRTTTATFDDDFSLFYSDFSQSQFANKPLMVGENGSQDFMQYNTQPAVDLSSRDPFGCAGQSLSAAQGLRLFRWGHAANVGPDDNNGQGNGGLATFAILGASPSFSPPPQSRWWRMLKVRTR